MPIADAPSGTWLRELFQAARLLTAGSLALLLAAFAWMAALTAMTWSFAFGELLLASMLSGIGASLHAVAWMRLRRASMGSRARAWTFRASVIGFIVGLLTLPWVSWILTWIYFVPLTPMVPSVFAPVVIAHAVLFTLFSRSFGDRRGATIVLGASGFLIADSVAGLLAQVLTSGGRSLYPGPPPAFVLVFAGVTVVGYGLVAFGARRAIAGSGATAGRLPEPENVIDGRDSAF